MKKIVKIGEGMGENMVEISCTIYKCKETKKIGNNVHYCMYTNGQLRIFKVFFSFFTVTYFHVPQAEKITIRCFVCFTRLHLSAEKETINLKLSTRKTLAMAIDALAEQRY